MLTKGGDGKDKDSLRANYLTRRLVFKIFPSPWIGIIKLATLLLDYLVIPGSDRWTVYEGSSIPLIIA